MSITRIRTPPSRSPRPRRTSPPRTGAGVVAAPRTIPHPLLPALDRFDKRGPRMARRASAMDGASQVQDCTFSTTCWASCLRSRIAAAAASGMAAKLVGFAHSSPPGRSTACVIRFDSVSKRYPGGREALSNLSFRVETGEMAFVTGHSGAGKTTLLKLIALIERPTGGAIEVGGQNLARVKRGGVARLRRGIGMVFQDHRLLMDRSVADNVALPLVIAGMPREERARRVRAALDKVGLGGRGGDAPAALSAGEQQRVGIARAIAGRPALIIADEPTGNLDPQLAEEIMRLFVGLREAGTTILIASHDLPLLKRMKQRAIVLDHGRLIDDVPASEVA